MRELGTALVSIKMFCDCRESRLTEEHEVSLLLGLSSTCLVG